MAEELAHHDHRPAMDCQRLHDRDWCRDDSGLVASRGPRGRKKILLIGLSIFGIASLWVGLSPTTGFGDCRESGPRRPRTSIPRRDVLVSNATHALGAPSILASYLASQGSAPLLARSSAADSPQQSVGAGCS